jgi:DNA adenine methylase
MTMGDNGIPRFENLIMSSTVCVNQLNPVLSDGNGIRPPLKWAGGKRWLVPYLRPIWARYQKRKLVEPFCGGLAVTLGLLPDQALLNDANFHAINFYRQLKKGLKATLEMSNDERAYYQCRDRFNELISSKAANTREAAVLFYYLNRTGYNGLCRFNRGGGFNVPFGRYSNINYTKDFSFYQQIFSQWTLRSGDFEKVPVESGDFIYADPPYDVEFRQYSKDGFTWEDQERLAEWLVKHKGPVVLSNQATPRVLTLYARLGFKLTILEAPRMISCTGDRSKAEEVLATLGL